MGWQLSEAAEVAARKAAQLAARRAAAAFGFAYGDLRVTVGSDLERVTVRLETTAPDGGQPLIQSRSFVPGPWKPIGDVAYMVDEMAFLAALALRSTRQAAAPSGWSIHPVAAAVVAATGHPLPNPADPRTWIAAGRGEITLPNGGGVANAVLCGQSGVLLLKGASLVDATGDALATLKDDAGDLLLTLYGAFPHTLAEGLRGRPARSVCALFDADPRGGGAPIWKAQIDDERTRLEITFRDTLVPLLPQVAGKERWRPRRARLLLPDDGDGHGWRDLHRVAATMSHRSAHTMRHIYARRFAAVAQRRGACVATPVATCGSTTP